MNNRPVEHPRWEERYRPKTISDVVLPPKIKKTFLDYIEEGEMPHLLLVSDTPGTGKTTTALAIANDMGADILHLNSRGMDNLSKIISFATQNSIYANKRKVCILDEFDGASPQLQKALRVPMEEYSKNLTIIMTANYRTQVIDAVQDRCDVIDFNFNKSEDKQSLIMASAKRITDILKEEKVVFDNDTLIKLIVDTYPAIRPIIKKCQFYAKMNGNVIDKGIFSMKSIENDFYEKISKKDFVSVFSYIKESNISIDEAYRGLFDIYLPTLKGAKYGESLIVIADYMDRHGRSLHPDINLSACVVELMGI
jgi:DNA polymerase III delta prime subunit